MNNTNKSDLELDIEEEFKELSKMTTVNQTKPKEQGSIIPTISSANIIYSKNNSHGQNTSHG